jgi:iron complex transport system substrate-binding protein
MAAVAAHLPPSLQRRRALILTPVVDKVYGGTTGTSFHDIVVAAGLIDAAAGRFADPWQQIGAEAALAIDPDVIVTRGAASEDLRRIPGFANLRALREGAVIELPVELYDSPGLSMLDAAELLHEKAYP